MLATLRRAIARYARWLHTGWPSGTVEKLPPVGPDGETNLRGVRIAGDLAGVPLLKFAADTGARAVRAFAAERRGGPDPSPDALDLAIVGAGVAGIAAALEARKLGWRFALLESARPFSTIANFPKGKPIFTYPTEMRPAGDLQVAAGVKEDLLAELESQRVAAGIEPETARVDRLEPDGPNWALVRADGRRTVARRVLIAIGRSGDYRRIGAPGEDSAKVSNRLHDPADYRDKNVLVVGGGDSALETAAALAEAGARVTLSYRREAFSRPKPENLERLWALSESGKVELALGTTVAEIGPHSVRLKGVGGAERDLPNDCVFAMLGREAPLAFLRKSGLRVAGDWTRVSVAACALFLLFCFWLFHWKSGHALPFVGALPAALNPDPSGWWAGLRAAAPNALLETLAISASSRSFYYTLAYCLIVVGFGAARIRRRRTPYVAVQTLALMALQFLPLFLLPEILLPWAGHAGWFDAGAGRWWADQFFPAADYGHGREYWRAYGFVLAWPLFVYNWFTAQPLVAWLIVGFLQTFVLIPWLVYRFGKGAYCGWICSCGALAETLGDNHRHKMPHGPSWNRLNLIGQVFLLSAALLLLLRVAGWLGLPGANTLFELGFRGIPALNYGWMVDTLWSGIFGVGFYFWFSGRVWCRFACPLAALMHIYARFSRFRIFAEKAKCISCNACTAVCHQGIDVMAFANRGRPMEDPQCVRCSACVHTCPTGVLRFGRLGESGPVYDRLAASPVRQREG